MLTGIHEVWAPNDYVAAAIGDVFTGPIRTVPPCVAIDQEADYPDRADLGLDEGRFYFIYSFDYFSFPQRKNPLGVLRAFREAFPDLNANIGLVIKSTGSEDHHPPIRRAIREAQAADPRIVVIDRGMDRREMLGLIRACDCYASLHRAEGFGLGMVEAMMFGRPVIGTAFSGSTDFLSEETGFPVPYKLRPVRSGEYVWTSGQVWAEPDHSSAVRLMRQVYEEPGLRQARAAAGQAFARARYGPEAVGAAVEAALRVIYENRFLGTPPKVN
jgi:glycosyltransferase involved in cell wall biosynthesis